MAKINVRYARILSDDISVLIRDIASILQDSNLNNNIIDDEQAILTNSSSNSVLFRFNRGRELNSTLRKDDGTDCELIPQGGRATETMYVLIHNDIMAYTGTQYSPSPVRFIEYFIKLYKQKEDEQYRNFFIEEIYNEELLEAIKSANWTRFSVAVVINKLPNDFTDNSMFGRFICEGRQLATKTLRFGMTDGITNIIKNSVLSIIDYTSSAKAKADDKKVGEVNLHKYRLTYSEIIGRNELLSNRHPDILRKAIDDYNNR